MGGGSLFLNTFFKGGLKVLPLNETAIKKNKIYEIHFEFYKKIPFVKLLMDFFPFFIFQIEWITCKIL